MLRHLQTLIPRWPPRNRGPHAARLGGHVHTGVQQVGASCCKSAVLLPFSQHSLINCSGGCRSLLLAV